MGKKGQQNGLEQVRRTTLRLGYVRLLDAAPVIMAESMGYYENEGLRVELSKEVGWATIRDKLAFGELDAVHGPSPMGLAMKLGIGVIPTDVKLGMILSWGGNAIILSNRIWEEGYHHGASFGDYVRNRSGSRKLILGTVSHHSCHYLMLKRWLASERLAESNEVTLTVLPPEQMVRNLSAGNIDGYCVGEPWGSVAIAEGFGWAIALSEEILPRYPEKGLWINERFTHYHPDACSGLIRALKRSCEYCSESSNTENFIKILSEKRYLNCAPDLLRKGLGKGYDCGKGKYSPGALVRFDGDHQPKHADGKKLLSDLAIYNSGYFSVENQTAIVGGCFGEELYEAAIKQNLAIA